MTAQELADHFPPGTKLVYGDKDWWVVGYTWDGFLQLSEIDPEVDYQQAVATRRQICKCCQDKLISQLN